MTMLLNEKTKQEKIIDEIQKKRNLFGLGLTSLIAACSTDDAATEVDLDKRPKADLEADRLAPTHTIDNMGADVAIIPIASTSDGGAPERTNSAINDVQITVTPEQGGFSGDDPLILRIANGNHLSATANASIYTDLTAVTNQHDLVVSSSKFGDVAGNITGAVYIFWDIGSIDSAGIATAATADGILARNHFKIEGQFSAPGFFKLGGKADQTDMFLSAGTNLYILWDVGQHATKERETKVELGDAGILHIQGVNTERTSGERGSGFIKINNNEDYDMILKGGSTITTYILWDITNYHDAATTAATPVVDFTGATATNATHGLLTIKDLLAKDIMKATTEPDEGGFTDIDGKGTNDLAFAYDGNTYILFGEKVANIDEESGKAISHTVDLAEVAGGTFYDKDATLQDEGFFDFDLDGTDENSNPKVEKVGYRFIGTDQDKLGSLEAIKTEYETAINPTADGGALSEEVYWDIA